jgi:hypothetical protein
MAGTYRLDAGGFSAWLRSVRLSLVEGRDAEVPCGDCDACCTSSWLVHVCPDEKDALAHIPARVLVPAPGRPPGHLVIEFDPRGRCPLIDDGMCSVYAHRPRSCRNFDCRVFAAAGLEPGTGTTSPLAAHVRRWQFSYPTDRDREEHAAVRAAGQFLRKHGACFPVGAARCNATAVASLAVRVYEVFRAGGDGSGATTEDELVQSVVAARDAFSARMNSR